MPTLVELTIVLLVCPAALAMWTDSRFPSLRPRGIRPTTIHLGITGLLAFVCMRPLLSEIFALMSGPGGRIVALCVACSVITYSLMVSLWVVRLATDAARPSR
ncbi:MAG: hypothetical protein ACTHNU_03390 [Gaiellales bacterium]|jgi:hypothetical protein